MTKEAVEELDVSTGIQELEANKEFPVGFDVGRDVREVTKLSLVLVGVGVQYQP